MNRSFTLIEILIAMAIMVVIFVSTFAIFRASTTSWRKGEIRTVRYQEARFILERMSKEIASSVPSSLAGPYCFGTADSFYFICTLADAPASLIEVGYRINGQELMRSYESLPDYDFSTFELEETLSENVSSLGFEYSTGAAWQESWDSRPGAAQAGLLPKAVKISFDIRDEKGSRTESFSTVVTLATATD